MIAMLRTSGVPAIYEHGKKEVIGHYWPRTLVSKNNWVKVDSTHAQNGYNYTNWSVKRYPVVRQLYSLGNNVDQCKKIPDKNVIKALNKAKYK
jgi:hypothetical protein